MPDRSLHRLESYQSGGSVGAGGEVGDGNIDVRVNGSHDDVSASASGAGMERSNGGIVPRLFAQFSLIGDTDDEDDGGAMTETSYRFGTQSRRWRRWFITNFWRIAIVLAICLTVYAISEMRADKTARKKNHGKASSSSTTTTSSSEHESCPIQQSYSVSSDIMELKNSSTVENVQNGAVATDHPLCSQVGMSILKNGGNAADSAVATTLCLGVVNPTSSGIGGGAFILVHSDAKVSDLSNNEESSPSFEDAREESSSKNSKSVSEESSNTRKKTPREKVTEFIDCRETAPLNSTYDMFESNPESSVFGGLAIAIPGELRGLELLHQRHGSMPWEDLVRPAMELARDGFVVESYLATAIREKEEAIRQLPNMAHILSKNNDGVTLLKEGDVMIRGQYAKTLEAIMYGGADAFYKGDLASMLAKDIQDAGGIITATDISNYRPVLRDPLIAQVAGYNVAGAPPPSSGGAVIIGALRFLAGFAMPYSALVDTLSKHWYVEACRHVFSIRMSLSDPGFAPEENSKAVKDLVEGEYMENLRKQTLDDSVLNLSQYGGPTWAKLKDSDGKESLVDAQEGDRRRRLASEGTPARHLRLFNYLEDHGTSSLSVVDKNRNTVSITSSVNLRFGSKVVSPSTGIVLNNQMDDFSSPGRVNYFGLHPSEANYVAPGKRPLSSMSPTFVFRDTAKINRGQTTEEASSTDPDNSSNNNSNLGELVMSLGASGGPKIIR